MFSENFERMLLLNLMPKLAVLTGLQKPKPKRGKMQKSTAMS